MPLFAAVCPTISPALVFVVNEAVVQIPMMLVPPTRSIAHRTGSAASVHLIPRPEVCSGCAGWSLLPSGIGSYPPGIAPGAGPRRALIQVRWVHTDRARRTIRIEVHAAAIL